MTSPRMSGYAPPPASLIKLAEGAALIGVNPRTLRRWIAQGKLNGWRLASNQIRIDRVELRSLAKPITPTADEGVA